MCNSISRTRTIQYWGKKVRREQDNEKCPDLRKAVPWAVVVVLASGAIYFGVYFGIYFKLHGVKFQDAIGPCRVSSVDYCEAVNDPNTGTVVKGAPGWPSVTPNAGCGQVFFVSFPVSRNSSGALQYELGLACQLRRSAARRGSGVLCYNDHQLGTYPYALANNFGRCNVPDWWCTEKMPTVTNGAYSGQCKYGERHSDDGTGAMSMNVVLLGDAEKFMSPVEETLLWVVCFALLFVGSAIYVAAAFVFHVRRPCCEGLYNPIVRLVLGCVSSPLLCPCPGLCCCCRIKPVPVGDIEMAAR